MKWLGKECKGDAVEKEAGLRGAFESGIDVTRRRIAGELHCFKRLLSGIRMDCGKVRERRAFAGRNVKNAHT